MACRELLCHGLRGDDSKPVTGSKGGSTLEAIAWGGGYHGQLGVRLKGDKGEGSKKTVNTAVKITFPDDEEPRHVACGGSFSAVVTSSGKVYTWGMGKEGQLGYKLTVVSGQQPEPLQVTGELSSVQVMAIACGREHTLVLTFGGDVYSWGSNKYGQLGHGDHHNQPEPRRIELEGGAKSSFSHIATGDQHSAALRCGHYHVSRFSTPLALHRCHSRRRASRFYFAALESCTRGATTRTASLGMAIRQSAARRSSRSCSRRLWSIWKTPSVPRSPVGQRRPR